MWAVHFVVRVSSKSHRHQFTVWSTVDCAPHTIYLIYSVRRTDWTTRFHCIETAKSRHHYIQYCSVQFSWFEFGTASALCVNKRNIVNSALPLQSIVCTQSVLVDSLCYLLSSVSRDSALNKTAVISQCSQNTTPRLYRTNETNETFFFDVVVANCCFSVMWWWKPFLRTARNWQSWTESFETHNGMYDVRVSNERAAAAAAMWSFIFGLTILDRNDEIQDGGHRIFSTNNHS